MAHARLCKQLKRQDWITVMLWMGNKPGLQVTLCVLCLHCKARRLRCSKEDAQDSYFGCLHRRSVQVCLGVCPSAFPLDKNLQCLSHPFSISTALQHYLTLGHISVHPARPVSTEATPWNLSSIWVQVFGPSPSGRLLLATSACFHACVVYPFLWEACSKRCKPWVLGPCHWCVTCCSQKQLG